LNRRSYALPAVPLLRLAAAGLLGHRRSLRDDARDALRFAPPIRVEGRAGIPAQGPFLVVMNHYNHPKIGVWWPVMALSAALPADPHWVMTAAWTFPGWLGARTLGPLSAWAFRRVANVYGFTNMPVMPPRPHEEAERAAAVRRITQFTRSHPNALVGLAPEGHNTPDLSLGWPPSGSGRFMLNLAERLGRLLPVGVYAEDSQLTVRFGAPFELPPPAVTAREALDRVAAEQVMREIARLLPAAMRGEFA